MVEQDAPSHLRPVNALALEGLAVEECVRDVGLFPVIQDQGPVPMPVEEAGAVNV